MYDIGLGGSVVSVGRYCSHDLADQLPLHGGSAATAFAIDEKLPPELQILQGTKADVCRQCAGFSGIKRNKALPQQIQSQFPVGISQHAVDGKSQSLQPFHQLRLRAVLGIQCDQRDLLQIGKGQGMLLRQRVLPGQNGTDVAFEVSQPDKVTAAQRGSSDDKITVVIPVVAAALVVGITVEMQLHLRVLLLECGKEMRRQLLQKNP